jgi:hypothetical protein
MHADDIMTPSTDLCENLKCDFYATCQLVDGHGDDDAIEEDDLSEFDDDLSERARCVCPGNCLSEVSDNNNGTFGLLSTGRILMHGHSNTLCLQSYWTAWTAFAVSDL